MLMLMLMQMQMPRLIEDMVRIPSPTGEEGELVEFLVNWANANGFTASKDEVGNFVAQCGSRQANAREILLVGHVDTVRGDIPVRIEGNGAGITGCDYRDSAVCPYGSGLYVATERDDGGRGMALGVGRLCQSVPRTCRAVAGAGGCS